MKKGTGSSISILFHHPYRLSMGTMIAILLCGIILSILSGALLPMRNALLGQFASSVLAPEQKTLSKQDPIHPSSTSHPDSISNLLMKSLNLALLTWSVGFGTSFCWKFLGQHFRDLLEEKMFKLVLHSRQDWKYRHSYSSILNQNVDLKKIEELIAWNVGLVPQYLTTFVIGVELSCIILCTFPVVGIVLGYMHKEMAKQDSNLLDSYRDASRHIYQVFLCLETISDFRQETRELETYTHTLSQSRTAQRWKSLVSGVGWGLYGGTMLFGYAVALFVGGSLVSEGQLEPGHVVSTFTHLAVGITALGNLGTSFKDFNLLKSLLSKMADVLEELESAAESELPSRHDKEAFPMISSLNLSISFVNIHFQYPEAECALYKSMSVRIPASEVTVIMGPSGCGKSTLFSLLTRAFDAKRDSGVIQIGNVDVQDIPLSYLRSNVIFVRSTPFLFHGTLRENLLLTTPSSSFIPETALIEACQAMCIWDMVKSLPNGFETPMADILSRWSGGEKQRLVLVRYFIANPPILILDESTSALDPDTERRVLTRLLQKRSDSKLLTILVTHRSHVLRNHATFCILMDRKKSTNSNEEEHCQVVYQGSPKNLSPGMIHVEKEQEPLLVLDSFQTSELSLLQDTSMSNGIKGDTSVSNQHESKTSKKGHELVNTSSFWKQQKNLWSLIRKNGGTNYVIYGMIGAALEGVRPPIEGYLIGKVVQGYGLSDPAKIHASTLRWASCMVYMGIHAVIAATLFHGGFGYLGADIAFFVRQNVLDYALKRPWLVIRSNHASEAKSRTCSPDLDLASSSSHYNYGIDGPASEWELRLSTYALEVERLGGPFWAELMRSFIISSLSLFICLSKSPLFTFTIVGCCACAGLILLLLQKILHHVQKIELRRQTHYRTTFSNWIEWIPEICSHAKQSLFLEWYRQKLLTPFQQARLWTRIVESCQHTIVDTLVIILFSIALFFADLLMRFGLYEYARIHWNWGEMMFGFHSGNEQLPEDTMGSALVVLMTMVMAAVQGLPVVNGIFYILGPLQLRVQPLLHIVDELIADTPTIQTRGKTRSKERMNSRQFKDGVQVHITGLNVRAKCTKSNVLDHHSGKRHLLKEFLLRDLYLTIPPSQVIAIVGASGSGKSTLLRMIADAALHRINPDFECFQRDERYSRPVTFLACARRRTSVIESAESLLVAMVRQFPQFFNRSLLDNLLYGCNQYEGKRLDKILDITGLKSVIDSLPEGLNTPLGEKGHILSSGQLQRIALARALLLEMTPILILDEAMSALDADLEKEILQKMVPFCRERNQTLIIVTHHLAPTLLSDKIVVLKDGAIVSQGVPDLVQKSCPEFRRLFFLSS